MLRPAVLAAALLAVVTLPAAAQDHSRTERVQFARGASSATLHGNLHGYDSVDYVLGARRGQTLSVRMQTSNASAYFNVLPSGGDGTALDGAANVVDWRGVLPANGDYVVRVYLMRNAARRDEHANYTLSIGVR
ncbi:hypothetical protein [Brevundimonas sp.]|uniref:hypothetical protein n=1 Tax=Brevundimonas sp. TaxID=1871086 RepID=UPI003D6C8A25